MNVLVFGASGQVGFELLRALAPVAQVVAPGWGGCPRVDLEDFAALENSVAELHPDVVINAAAHTAVDKAESERDRATRINAEAPGVMARAAAKLGAVMVHYSTDYVFDGSGSAARREDEAAAPLNHYGASKLAGEQAVAAANPRQLTLRTSWVYATHGRNFAKTILRLAAEREELSVVADQEGAPTGAPLIADATVHALLRLQQNPEAFGLHHLTARGVASWHEFASFLCSEAVACGLLQKAPIIKPITSADYPTPARRPLNSRLDVGKFERSFGLRLPAWQDGAAHFLRELARARG